MPKILTRASCRNDWKRISAESSLMSPWRPDWSRDWTELNWLCVLPTFVFTGRGRAASYTSVSACWTVYVQGSHVYLPVEAVPATDVHTSVLLSPPDSREVFTVQGQKKNDRHYFVEVRIVRFFWLKYFGGHFLASFCQVLWKYTCTVRAYSIKVCLLFTSYRSGGFIWGQ